MMNHSLVRLKRELRPIERGCCDGEGERRARHNVYYVACYFGGGLLVEHDLEYDFAANS